MTHLSSRSVGTWKHHDVIMTWKHALQKSNSTQKMLCRKHRRFLKKWKLFHFLNSSIPTTLTPNNQLINHRSSNPSPNSLHIVLCKLMKEEKKVRLTINPKEINHILSCQPTLLSSQNKHHDKNSSSIHEIYTYVYMKRNICIYRSKKVTL